MPSVARLRAEAAGCTRCDLHRDATQAVLGPKVRVTRDRGVVITAPDEESHDTLVTVHSSAILRTKPPDREVAFDALVRDLEVAARRVRT